MWHLTKNMDIMIINDSYNQNKILNGKVQILILRNAKF